MSQKYQDFLFQAIFDHPSIGASINDHANRFIKVNKKLCQMLGYSESEIIGKTPLAFTLSGDLEKSHHFHDNLSLAAELSGEYEKRYLRKDGSILWARVIAKRIENPEFPSQVVTIALIEDITSVQAVKAQAELDHLQLKTILNTAVLGVWCVDANWQITFSNRALQDLLGYSEESMLKLNLRDITHPEDLLNTNAKFNQTKHGESYQAVRRYLKSDGTYLWTRLSVSKFPDNDRKLFGLAIVEDISEQVKAEEIIQEQQIKIISSAKMAALGEMAGGVAHEINNPLAVIIGKVDQISRKLDSISFNIDDTRKELLKVQTTANRIASIVRGLRTFSRDAENDPWMHASVMSLIEDAAALCQERFRSLGIKFSVNISSDLQIKCRPTQLVQVLINLLSNSVDAIEDLPEKWISIEVCQHGDMAQIVVTDSGSGIPPEIARKIMQPFFTTKSVGKGTGLGLSIAIGIAQDHNGSLKYDSTSKNTRFTLDIPVATTNDIKSA